MKTNRFERGQALIVIALALVGIIGVAGLVIDGGNAFQDRQQAQNAADAAALASAYARSRGLWCERRLALHLRSHWYRPHA